MKFLRFISVFMLIAWMVLIFFLSSQTADVSSNTSGGIIEIVVSVINPDFKDLSAEARQIIIESLQGDIRNLAHFAVYFILGIFSILSFVTYKRPNMFLKDLFAFLICGAYSLSDEYHQSFIDGRAFEYSDIITDCLGALCAILFVTFIALEIISKKHKSEEKIKLNKKELLKQTEILFNRCESIKAENEDLKREIADLKSELALHRIINTSNENPPEAKAAETEATEPLTVTDEVPAQKIISEDDIKNAGFTKEALNTIPEKLPELTSDKEFAAEIIGKIVLSSAGYCNSLTATRNDATTKELVNLILGKTEVTKAEIFEIVSGDASDELKRSLILSKQREAEDYFLSVMAQR